MAHNVEPMDIDNIDSDFDNKENSILHSNVYPRTPCTEKGYEELDVSELNMKLRYSITPAASPMSKSYTANCVDNKMMESGDDTLNANLTRSLHSAMSKGDIMNKSVKTLPLQTISSEPLVDSNRNASVLRSLDSTVVVDGDVTVTVTQPNDLEENISFPSSSSSTTQTPGATTPTKEIPRNDGGSPIMRGLKSVLNMFRSSQSPIPPADSTETTGNQVLSPTDIPSTPDSSLIAPAVLASTPISTSKHRDGNISKSASPHRESLVFNEDLEKELLWKDETTILFSQEKIPIHKLFFQPAPNLKDKTKNEPPKSEDDLNSTVEYMDISYNDSIIKNKTITDLQAEGINESDSEFVDCETTFTNDKSEVGVLKDNELINEKNTSTTNMVPDNQPANKDASLQQDSVRKESPHPVLVNVPDSDLTTDEKCDISVPATKQDGSEIPVNTEVIEVKENTENGTYDISATVLNTNVTKVIDSSLTNVDSNLTKTESVPCKVVEEFNSTFETGMKGSEPLQEENPSVNVTFDTCNLPAQDTILKSDNNFDNVTVVIESSVPADSSISQNNVINPVFDKQIDSSLVGSNVCNVTYNPEMDDKTFLKDIDNVNNVIATEKLENATFIKGIESLPLPLVDTNLTVDVISEDVTFIKEIKNIPKHSDENINPTEDTTFVKEIISASDPSNMVDAGSLVKDEATFVMDGIASSNMNDTKTFAKTEEAEATFLKAMETVPDLSNLNDALTDNLTYVSETEIPVTELNSNKTMVASKTEHSTFVKETKGVSFDNITLTGNAEYSNFVKNIEKESTLEDKSNTSTPSADTIHDSPANVPLPDEDDIEAEKSLGASMLVEEKTIPVEFDINNITVTKLDNTDNVEEMPMEREAKSIDGNKAINYPIVEKETYTVINIDNKIQVSGLSEENKTTDNVVICEDKDLGVVHLNASEVSPQDISMDINESVTGEHQDIVAVSTCTFTLEDLEHKLDVTVEKMTIENGVINAASVGMNTKVELPESNVAKNGGTDIIIKSDIACEDGVISEHNETENQAVTTTTVDSVAVEDETNELQNEQTVTKITDLQTSISSNKTVAEILRDQFCTDKNDLPLDSIHDKKLPDSIPNDSDPPKEPSDSRAETTQNKENEVSTYIKNNEIKDEAVEKFVDEVILSENSSPYVSVAGEIDSIPVQPENVEDSHNPFATKSRVVLTPPSSPKIVSKGYNFNFDEIDDPFATKTKIRLSPTPEKSPKDSINVINDEGAEPPQRDTNRNRRKSQPERKKPLMPKKKLNSTFSGPLKTTKGKDVANTIKQSPKDIEPKDKSNYNSEESQVTTENKIESLNLTTGNKEIITTMKDDIELDKSSEELENNVILKEQKSLDDRDVDTTTENIVDKEKSSVESLNVTWNEMKATSSSEQSTYYSAGTSSSEGTASKNVFNIPEIDDLNFNPFATKSKMRQSPPPGLCKDAENEAPSLTEPQTISIKEDVDIKASSMTEEKECVNISNVTCSSKTTDEKDITVREVHTEDEDTEEGPFLEDDNDKMSDFDGEDVDMMQFSELPPQNNEDNMEAGEMFIDAEAFEFLLNQNKSNVVSDSGKESLFLKFDPLFAKRVSTDGVLAALNKIQKRQSTPKKTTPFRQMDATFEKPGPPNLDVTHEVESNVTAEESTEDLNVTVSKPMMVVTPAVNPVATPRNKTLTPTSSNRRSITFTSPAIAVIDRLLSLSANNSLVGHDSTAHVSREQSEADLALTQLRELLAEKEINVYNLRCESKELKDRLSSLELQMKTLETESQERLKKVNELNEKLSEKTKLNRSMAAVVEEYERTIASLIAETEQDKRRHHEERIKLIKERDEQTAHLASMEVSFSDLHSKYEKSKQIILTCKANEDAYKKSIKEFEGNLSKMQSNYELLKQHATSKLNHANQELEKMNRTHESEVLKMNAMIKRKELHITSLEETLAQKTKANEELTAICDELINKVG